MLKQITFDEFREKHPLEYNDLLTRLSLISLDRVVLKVSGINNLKIYSIGRRRFFSCLTNADLNPIIRSELFGNRPKEKGTERFILTTALCTRAITHEWLKSDDNDLLTEHIEYAVLIKNHHASFGLISMEKTLLIKDLVSVFLHTIDKFINVESTSIMVPTNDAYFLEALKGSGYNIGEERPESYQLVKGLIQEDTPLDAGSINTIHKP